MELDLEKAKRLLSRIAAIPRLFDDRSPADASLSKIVMSRNALMWELGDEHGVVYAADVGPGSYVYAHIVVLNRRRLPDLEDQIRGIIKWGFELFQPAVVASWIPEFNRPARALAVRLGWHLDGILRKHGLYSGKREDLYVYSVTREDHDGQ